MVVSNEHAIINEEDAIKVKRGPLDALGCMIRRPLIALGYHSWGFEKMELHWFTLIFRVSRKACIMYAKMTGKVLSPCWNHVLYQC
jgi:hypothetical protein